jgi:signal peptidase I
MNEEKASVGRNRQWAVLLSFIMPGLGQIYNGEFIKGTSYFVILQAIFIICYRWSVLLPDKMLIFGPVLAIFASLALYAIAIRDAYQEAGTHAVRGYNRWYFYLAAWLLGYVIVSGVVLEYGRTNYMEAFVIPSISMEPAVLKGDRILVDKTAYRRIAPQKNDIIVFVYPDDRSKAFIKRIEALPGETITLADGTKETVPHGHIYLMGDNRENSLDSRQFGFVPLRDVMGKARVVYYSTGEGGVRWGRIGTTLS